MIGFFMNVLGFNRMWAWVAAIGLPILVIAGIYFAIDAFGDSRYRQGESVEHAKWIAANNKLLREAAEAKSEAEKKAAAAALNFAAKQEEERDRIDAALQNGSSPVDALFPAGNGM